MAYRTVELTETTDSLYDQAVAEMQRLRPGWEPDEASVLTILMSVAALYAYEQASVAASRPDDIFSDFGQELYGLAAQAPTFANGATTWFASDTLGHTIPAGEELTIGGIGFVVLEPVTIPPGSAATGMGQVQVGAILSGEEANGLSGPAEPVNALAWIDHIDLVGTTAGGSDPETDQAYRERLAEELTTVSPSAITADDFRKFARRVPGVFRSLVLDTYDPDTDTYDNPGVITVAAIDREGNPADEEAVMADLEARRGLNIDIKWLEPTSNEIDVDVDITVHPSHDAADVESRVQAAIEDYLSPATWGLPVYSEDPREWTNDTKVRLFELVTIINNVVGVNNVSALTINGSAADATMTGEIPLPTPGTVTVDVV